MIRHQMKKIQSKTDLLWKKFNAFGLSKEEAQRYSELKVNFDTLYDEFRDAEFERVLMKYLYDKDIVIATKKIQALVPWEGGLVLKDTEFEAIIEAETELTLEEKESIKNHLTLIHQRIFINFEKFAAKDGMETFLLDLAAFVSQRESAGIEEVVRCIDDRYREFAELLGIDLEEVEIVWKN